MARKAIMTKKPKALLLDDDPNAVQLLTRVLQHRFPTLAIESRMLPNPEGQFDLYFIDNEFEGECMAGALASEVRRAQPNALIVAFSGRLDAPTLKALVNSGCNGACDKSDPRDVARLLDIVDAYLEARESVSLRDSGSDFLGVIRSITELIREWNRRLDLNQQALAQSGSS
jgi:DNA-binding NarL/FixJ family response regulator